jgi:predicted phosphoadenosine phosphosulfate sulfurtransferase
MPNDKNRTRIYSLFSIYIDFLNYLAYQLWLNITTYQLFCNTLYTVMFNANKDTGVLRNNSNADPRSMILSTVTSFNLGPT